MRELWYLFLIFCTISGAKLKFQKKKKKSLNINCDLLTQMERIEISISKDV